MSLGLLVEFTDGAQRTPFRHNWFDSTEPVTREELEDVFSRNGFFSRTAEKLGSTTVCEKKLRGIQLAARIWSKRL